MKKTYITPEVEDIKILTEEMIAGSLPLDGTATITSKVVKAKADTDEAAKYRDYFDWKEPLKRWSSHRLLAMRRGESEGILRLSIAPIDDNECIERLQRHYVYGNTPCGKLVAEAVEDVR